MSQEVENSAVVDSGEVDSSAVSSPDVAAPEKSQEPAVEKVVEAAVKADSSAEAPVIPAYTPNFKFKANQKEMEFDEWIRPVVKTAETEKKLRELYEKAHGLDTIKPERDQLKTQFTELTREHGSVQNGLQKLSRFVQEKDYESFFQSLGIPKADVMQYALMQLKLQEASPEQRQAYEQQRQTSLRAQTLEEQNEILRGTYQQQAAMVRSNELNLALQRPEVSGVMQAFDARLGRVGAFRDEVIKRGQLYAYQTGQDIPTEQVVQEVLSMYGMMPQAPIGNPQVVTPERVAAQKKTIPNISGRSTSPVQKTFKDIDDLKKHVADRLGG